MTAPAAGAGEVLVRVLEVGVCGTDREIDHGLFGIAPADEDRLVIGHELLGTVEQDGHGFVRGELVAATVRRSCGHCLACAEDSPDSCFTGDYSERGITRLHGFARELVAEDAAQLVPIPASLGRLGVLAEPASICARALRHARAIGGRQPWELRRALVLGGGAVGTLTTFLLRLEGIEVWTASLEPAAAGRGRGCPLRPVRDALARARRVRSRGRGRGECAADGRRLGLLRRGGVACLLGIDGREQNVSLDGRVLGVDTILENRVLFGSVNARREDWLAAVAALDECAPLAGRARRTRSPPSPARPLREAFAEPGGKATLVLSE